MKDLLLIALVATLTAVLFNFCIETCDERHASHVSESNQTISSETHHFYTKDGNECVVTISYLSSVKDSIGQYFSCIREIIRNTNSKDINDPKTFGFERFPGTTCVYIIIQDNKF